MAEALQQHRHASRAVGTCAPVPAPWSSWRPTAPAHAGCAARLPTALPRAPSTRCSRNWPTRTSLPRTLAGLARVADRQDPGHAGAQHVVPLRGTCKAWWRHCRRPRHRTAAGGQLKPRRLQDALRTHPVWDALERRQGGTIETAAQRVVGGPLGRLGGCGEVQAAALSPLAQQMPQLIAGADAGLRRRYVQLVTDQLRHCAPAERNGRPRLPRPVGRPTRGPPDAAPCPYAGA